MLRHLAMTKHKTRSNKHKKGYQSQRTSKKLSCFQDMKWAILAARAYDAARTGVTRA